MRKTALLLIFFLIISSCKTHKYHNEMRKCINENYLILKKDVGFTEHEKPFIGNKFDIFKSIKKFETLLIDLKILKNKSKKSYTNLIKNKVTIFNKKMVIDNTKLYNPYMYSLHNNSAPYSILFYGSCPYNIVISKKGAMAYYPTKAIFEKIIENKLYPTKEHLTELLNVTDFKDETSRLILCNSIFMNWYKWNENDELFNIR